MNRLKYMMIIGAVLIFLSVMFCVNIKKTHKFILSLNWPTTKVLDVSQVSSETVMCYYEYNGANYRGIINGNQVKISKMSTMYINTKSPENSIHEIERLTKEEFLIQTMILALFALFGFSFVALLLSRQSDFKLTKGVVNPWIAPK